MYIEENKMFFHSESRRDVIARRLKKIGVIVKQGLVRNAVIPADYIKDSGLEGLSGGSRKPWKLLYYLSYVKVRGLI